MTQVIRIEKKSEKSGEKNGRAWKRIGVKDEAGVWYSAFSSAPFFQALEQAQEGATAEIAYDTETGNYGPQNNLTAFSLTEPPAEGPKLGDGSYVKGAEHPQKQRSIHASVALEQAVDSLKHIISRDMSPKDVVAKVEPLAHAYFLFLLRASGTVTDDDIPFEVR